MDFINEIRRLDKAIDGVNGHNLVRVVRATNDIAPRAIKTLAGIINHIERHKMCGVIGCCDDNEQSDYSKGYQEAMKDIEELFNQQTKGGV